MKKTHLFINFLYPFNPIQGHRMAGLNPCCHPIKCGVHPRQVADASQAQQDKQLFTVTLTPKVNLEKTNKPNMHVFVLWELRYQSTQREPTHTRGEHVNFTQKGPTRELKQEASWCGVTTVVTGKNLQLVVLEAVHLHFTESSSSPTGNICCDIISHSPPNEPRWNKSIAKIYASDFVVSQPKSHPFHS